MLVFEFTEGLAILLLSLEQVLIPLFVELLVLLDVGLLALLTLLSLVEDEFLVAAVIVLLLELFNTVLSHLSLNVFALTLTGGSMLLEHLAKVANSKLERPFWLDETKTKDMSSHRLMAQDVLFVLWR